MISLSVVGDQTKASGYRFVLNGEDEYGTVSEVAAALAILYQPYAGRPESDQPYISLRCDEKVTVDQLVEIIDLTRENEYKMVLATKEK